jgi:hypothetical protein
VRLVPGKRFYQNEVPLVLFQVYLRLYLFYPPREAWKLGKNRHSRLVPSQSAKQRSKLNLASSNLIVSISSRFFLGLSIQKNLKCGASHIKMHRKAVRCGKSTVLLHPACVSRGDSNFFEKAMTIISIYTGRPRRGYPRVSSGMIGISSYLNGAMKTSY